ncbi:25776_t:CDS:2, partial [Gigaspora rosea]
VSVPAKGSKEAPHNWKILSFWFKPESDAIQFIKDNEDVMQVSISY